MVMATKSSTKKTTKQKHDLLYIMSNSCGWCKKANPIVEELVKDGHKITTLDMMVPDDGKRANEVKAKYSAQCGTPLFIDAETGNSVCGFREKDVLEKWAKGEEIPKPPQPKSPPPPPPTDLETASDSDIKSWESAYVKWSKENDHLPNLLPFDQILERVKTAQKQRKQQLQNQQNGQAGGNVNNVPTSQNNSSNVTKNSKFYYIVENGERSAVFADNNYINSLKQQYYVRESDGSLTKVVGDNGWNNQNAKPSNPPASNKPTKEVSEKVKQQIAKSKQKAKEVKSKTEKKSKENTKTIESF
tara:strand:- start:757 stop:1662 length:906 start_codon:yes stop_codon:yes gene_type:complete